MCLIYLWCIEPASFCRDFTPYPTLASLVFLSHLDEITICEYIHSTVHIGFVLWKFFIRCASGGLLLVNFISCLFRLGPYVTNDSQWHRRRDKPWYLPRRLRDRWGTCQYLSWAFPHPHPHPSLVFFSLLLFHFSCWFDFFILISPSQPQWTSTGDVSRKKSIKFNLTANPLT
jgi:hypothetical protein